MAVSILARPKGRALHDDPNEHHHGHKQFQSSPGPRAGRCTTLVTVDDPRMVVFQSSPGPRAGRCAAGGELLGQHRRVSILARPKGRALRQAKTLQQSTVQAVSILARPKGRALLTTVYKPATMVPMVSILARPKGRALP